jgi:hypothetical protein
MKTNEEKIVMSAAERAFIDGFVKERCVPHDTVIARRLERWYEKMQSRIFESPIEWNLAAAGGILPKLHTAGGAQAPISPAESVRFVFASYSDEPGTGWRAELRIPPEATIGTIIQVKVTGLGVDSIPEGVLTLAGCKIPLVGGEGGILFDLFINGIRTPGISLTRPDGTTEPGKLLFM